MFMLLFTNKTNNSFVQRSGMKVIELKGSLQRESVCNRLSFTRRGRGYLKLLGIFTVYTRKERYLKRDQAIGEMVLYSIR